MTKRSCILLICLMISHTAIAAEFPNYIEDAGDMWTRGNEYLSDQYIALSGIALAEGLLIWRGDEFVRKNLVNYQEKRFNHPVLDYATYPAKWYGKNTTNLLMMYGGITAGYYLYGEAADNSKSIETAYLLLESFIFTAGIVEFWKILLGRARPFNDLGSKHFDPVTFNEHYHSLPSGHTAMAFSLMNTIARSSKSDLVKVPAYTFALSAGMQRIGSDVHWTSDVILGGLIGYGVSTFLYNNYYKTDENNSVQPAIRINFVIPL